MSQILVDVIVIGAGMAGLKAASELVAKGHTVVVLEADDRVGGTRGRPEPRIGQQERPQAELRGEHQKVQPQDHRTAPSPGGQIGVR